MHTFKINADCSSSIPSVSHPIYHQFSALPNASSFAIPSNPFVHVVYSSWSDLIEEVRSAVRQQPVTNLLSKLLLDSFLFNFANQISITYPLQLIRLFFQQSSSVLTRSDLAVVQRILRWYRSMLPNGLPEERMAVFLRKVLHPWCTNQLWSRPVPIDTKQTINEMLLDLCCSINHSICLQHIFNRNDPYVLLQFLSTNEPTCSLRSCPIVHFRDPLFSRSAGQSIDE